MDFQNLISAEVLSGNLLHSSRCMGTELDEVSHAAVTEEEEIVRPLIVGRISEGERRFDKFVDEGEYEREEEDFLPEDLTRQSQRGQWSVPTEGYISEKCLSTASRTNEVERFQDESEMPEKLDVNEDELQVMQTSSPEEDVRPKEPVAVVLTFDNNDEEEEEEDRPQAYAEEEVEEINEEDDQESTTPYTDYPRPPSHHQSPQASQATQPLPFHQTPLDQTYNDETLDSAMFNQQGNFPPTLSEKYADLVIVR